MSPESAEGHLVDLVDTTGLLVAGLSLPSHAASVRVAVRGQEIDARAYALDATHALVVARGLGEYGGDGERLTVHLSDLRSAGRTTRALRARLARLMDLPEDALRAWDERQVRHGLLYVLEATEAALRDQRLMALEAALGGRTTV